MTTVRVPDENVQKAIEKIFEWEIPPGCVSAGLIIIAAVSAIGAAILTLRSTPNGASLLEKLLYFCAAGLVAVVLFLIFGPKPGNDDSGSEDDNGE